MEVKRKKVI